MKKEDLDHLNDNLNYLGSILLWYVNDTESKFQLMDLHMKEQDLKIEDIEKN